MNTTHGSKQFGFRFPSGLQFAGGLVALLWMAACVSAQTTGPGEGADLAFGSAGNGPGQFHELRDIAFSPTGLLHTLEGARLNPKTKSLEGNLRVQRFDRSGKLVSSFDVSDTTTGQRLGGTNDPKRLAIDSAGNVLITQPAAGRVQQFSADGKFVRSFDVPGAMAIAVWVDPATRRELFAVVANVQPSPKGRPVVPGANRVHLLAADGRADKPIMLSQAVYGAQDLALDRTGNLFIKAEPNAIYHLAPDGKLVRTLGGNPTSRAEDGSELLHTVAVDSNGNIYSMTWGNPGLVVRFDGNGQSLTLRPGQWKWADPWSVHSSYVAFAIDGDDRLWVGVTNRHDPSGVNYAKYHASPAIVRPKADFFDPAAWGITKIPTRLPGFKPSLSCGLPYNVNYEPGKAIPMEYAVAAANRSVDRVTVAWRALDHRKTEVAAGRFDVALQNGRESRTPFSFVPPKFGAFTVLAQATSPDGDMGGVAAHVAVTDRYPFMPELPPGASPGGWSDPARQVFSGLPQLRIHPAKDEKGLAKTDAEIDAAERHKVRFVVQLVDNMKHLTPEHVRMVATRYKGRVPMYEVCNEPNFSSKPDDYLAGHRMAYRVIKEVDPGAKVMGPATVNMDLNWLARLYELGLKDVTDAIALHDYEGHESVDPLHWAWKLAAVRAIMSRHGDADKPIWQTERAIGGVRGQQHQGLVQAIRCALHRDVLETLGVPAERNHHYYLNQAGYSTVPSYLWSGSGPHAGIVVLRVRHALTAAHGRAYAGRLDFGPTGDTFLQGLRFAGGADGGTTLLLRNLGTSGTYPADFTTTATALAVTDAWGNTSNVAVAGGKVRLDLDQLPTYVTLAAGADLVPAKIDFGTNVAREARWEYSAAVEKGMVPPPPGAGAAHPLANGIYETFHSQNPHGNTDGGRIWTGALPLGPDGQPLPQTLTANFDRPQTIDRLIVRTVRADNAFCTLLAYDVQVPDGDGWKVLLSHDHPIPPSEVARSADARAVNWMDDTNLHVHALPAPVTTTAVRLVVRRTTWGFVPDTAASAGKPIPPKLMLREVEIFSTPGAGK